MIFYVEYCNCKEFFPFFGYIEWGANSNQWNTQIFIVFLVTTDSILTSLEFLFVFELERMAFEKNACIYDADAADFSLSLSLQCKTVSVHKDWHSFNYSSVSGSKQRQRVKSQVKKRWMNDCAWSLKNVHWNICLCNSFMCASMLGVFLLVSIFFSIWLCGSSRSDVFLFAISIRLLVSKKSVI